jgi:hypothetical protein
MKPRHLFAFAAFAALPALAATEPSPVRFYMVDSRVDLDANGTVLAVEAQGEDPEVVRNSVAAQVRKLHFSPASKDGKPATATTYVSMYACAEKAATGFVMSFHYVGHGPVYAPPRYGMGYPVAAERSGVPAHYDAVLQVRADGTATVEELVRREKGKGFDNDFRRVIGQWAKAQKFLPELVDGAPKATRVRTAFAFVLTPRGAPADPTAKARDCAEAFRLAREAYGADEALDSAVGVAP